MRSRKLPPEIVKSDWENAQKNVKDYKSIFGRDFVEVRNDDDLKSLESKAQKLYSKLLGWSGSFPSNKKAMQWKQSQLDAKRS